MFKQRIINLKIITDRARMHLSTVNFVMIMVIFLQATPYPFWAVLPVSVIGVLLLGYIDYKLVLPREHNRQTQLNPFMVEMRRDIKDKNH